MVTFTETKIELVQKFKDILASMTVECPCKPFELIYSDLDKAIQCSDTKLVLEIIAILEAPAAGSGAVAPFEFDLASKFITTCMVTAFPDTR